MDEFVLAAYLKVTRAIGQWLHNGTDFPTAEELIAYKRTAKEVGELLGVDSIYYQSLEALLGAASQPADHYCTACWTGRYPVAIDEPMEKFAFKPMSATRSEQAPTESP